MKYRRLQPMEVKTKHEKYNDFLTKKQLAEKGLIPTDEGVDLWTNSYQSKSAVYFDSTKAVKLETIYIWKNYFPDDRYTVTEIGAVDQLGNVFFNKPVKPSKEVLSQPFKADTWIDVERKNKFSGYDILFASSEDVVRRQLVSAIKKQKYVKNIVSYNTDFNIPSTLEDYKQTDLMEFFANIIKESYESFYGEKGYKWQKLEKFFEYYDVKPDGNRAVDTANALRKCYEKMAKNS